MTSVQIPEVKLPFDDVYAEAEWSRGFVRDMPRSSIPVGGAHDIVDFMIDRPGVAYKRGGWTYRGAEVGSATGGVGFVSAPEFPSGMKVLALGADGNVYDLSLTGSTLVGALGLTTRENPHLWVDRLAVTSADGTAPPKKISSPGGVPAIDNWGGTPPYGKFVTVHLSRVILAGSAAQPHRVWFSPVPNPELAWNTDESYIDTNHFITGICPCQGILLVFSGGHTERVVGDVIPGEVGENMALQPVGEVGCADSRTIAAWRGNVIFAGQGGVWVTNGVGFDSLTEKGDGSGISSYWRQQFDATMFDGQGTIAGGIYGRDFYFVSLSRGSTLIDTLVCYMPRKAWVRLSNTGIRSFSPVFVGRNELYGGSIDGMPGNRVLRMSGLFDPTATNNADANGVWVTPKIDLRMIGEGIGLKAYGHGHLTYDMRHVEPNAPFMTMSAATGIEADTGYTPVAEGNPFLPTTAVTRKRYIVNRDAQTLNLRLQQTNPTTQTELYAFEQEVRPYNVTADGP